MVGVLHGRGGRDRRDLSDALAAVGHGQLLVLLDVDGVDLRDVGGTEQAQGAVLDLRHAILERPVLGEGVAHAHQHAALDLALDGDGVDDAAGVVRGVDLGDLALVVQDDHVRGKAVADVALGVGHVGAQLVGGL